MVDLSFTQQTLFGEQPAQEYDPGEFFLGRILVERWGEARGRADWCMAHLPYTGDNLLEMEDALLLRESLEAFVFGNYASVVLTADAFIERLLTDFVEVRGYRAVARRGLSAIVDLIDEQGWVDSYVLGRILRLHAIRNNYVHEKSPDHRLRLFRRVLEHRMGHEFIMQEDAREALCLSYAMAARIKRTFPRLGIEAAE